MANDINTKISFKKGKQEITSPISEWSPFLIIKSSDKTNVVYVTEGKEMVIGRNQDAAIHLDDEQISRQHASILFTQGKVKIVDLNSTNGTIVNGQVIKEKILGDGDEILVGNSALQFFIPMSIGDRIAGISVKTHNYFEMRLSEELDRTARFERCLSLMMIGIDSDVEKVILDKLVSQLVLIVKDVIRTMDIMASYSRNEIELLLAETNKEESHILAEKILKETDKNTELKNVSIGISTFPDDSLSKELLFDKARRALKKARQKEKVRISDVREENVKTISFAETEIIINSQKSSQVFEMVHKIANSNISVLIQGETGVGKEVVAQAIHYNSPRKDKPLVSVNCVALTETLLESELFGHERGAFTGADKRKIGLFESANGGTIFLDEIGEMPLRTQSKLLRVLQARKIMRVGSSQEIDVDIRIIAATNKNLEDLVNKGAFREDLFYRLNAITINVPPLRERKEEITLLVQSFIKTFSKENGKNVMNVAPDALELLINYNWPGNVRELRNCIERAVVITEGDTIYKDQLAAKVFKNPMGKPTLDKDMLNNMEEPETALGDMKEIIANYEKKIILAALNKVNWNQSLAAQALKIPRRTLVSKIKKYNIM
jgi:diguanylate cyclase (GGDEF)-like protein